MIYDSNNQRFEDMGKYFGADSGVYRMAEVMEVNNGRPVIRFYGETVNAQKQYKYLSSYAPAIGDLVILACMARTYVILGKVV